VACDDYPCRAAKLRGGTGCASCDARGATLVEAIALAIAAARDGRPGAGGCGFGCCARSKRRGGGGCYLCDKIATLPQPTFGGKAALVETPDPFVEPVDPSLPEPPAAPVKKAAPRRRVPVKSTLW